MRRTISSPTRPRTPLSVLVLAVLAWALLAPAGADDALWRRIAEPDTFVILRHALAPGFGDPDGFHLGDCATQRNLDDAGREQARRIGEAFRAHGIARARVYSSEWCRCLDTAALLALGPVETLPALNSLHGRPEDRAPAMARLKAFLAGVSRAGPPVVLVSHQATMRALTGGGAGSGEIVVFRLARDGAVEVLGRIPPP